MTTPNDADRDFGTSDCSSSVIDVLIIDGPEHVGRTGSVRTVNGQPFDVLFFGKRLIKVDFADGTAFMAEPKHVRELDRSSSRYCFRCRYFRSPGWCDKHDNHVTSFLTCEHWDKAGCKNCNGTGRAWKICEFTNDPIMADCEGCDGGRLFN